MLDRFIIEQIKRDRSESLYIPLHIEAPPPPSAYERQEREEEEETSERGVLIIDFY